MPPRAWRLRIEDMLDAIRAIEEFVEGLDFDAFRNDKEINARFQHLGEWPSIFFDPELLRDSLREEHLKERLVRYVAFVREKL